MKKLVLLFVFCGIYVQAQYTIPDKPSFQTSVYDYADVLSQTEEKELENKLIRYSDSTSTQIVVISVEDLKFYNSDLEFVAEPGVFELFIGANSDVQQKVSIELVK